MLLRVRQASGRVTVKSNHFVLLIFPFITASTSEIGLGVEGSQGNAFYFSDFPFITAATSEIGLGADDSQAKSFCFIAISFYYCFYE